MVLFVIGLGLGDEKDITVKGLEAVKSCSRIYLEAYTSILVVDKEVLEKFYGKSIIVADRDMVESESDKILKNAGNENVAFLVVGDPFGATTHLDLVLRAESEGIPVQVIHNASIMNAIGCCGLQLYAFGQTVSIPFFNDKWRPTSFYGKIEQNLAIGLHTLCLLDIKVKEQTEENLLRGRKIYEPPRFMSINVALKQLLEAEEEHKRNVLSKDSLVIGVARVGTATQQVIAGTIEQLLNVKFGEPLHSLVIVGETHIVEKEFLEKFKISEKDVAQSNDNDNDDDDNNNNDESK